MMYLQSIRHQYKHKLLDLNINEFKNTQRKKPFFWSISFLYFSLVLYLSFEGFCVLKGFRRGRYYILIFQMFLKCLSKIILCQGYVIVIKMCFIFKFCFGSTVFLIAEFIRILPPNLQHI